jgi:hypothetical protein
MASMMKISESMVTIIPGNIAQKSSNT